MKRQTLVIGLLSVSAISLLTGCVDDKYDLTDIDTTSRFTVDNLTVPINLSEIKLENVINLDDNENIEKIPMEGGKECYAIVKEGIIDPTDFKLSGIHVNSPALNPSEFVVNIPSGIDLSRAGLPAIPFPEIPLQRYDFNMKDIDKALIELYNVKSVNPIKIEVTLSVPQSLAGSNNELSFHNLEVQLPWGLITDQEGYEKETGMLSVEQIPVDINGQAKLSVEAIGLDLEGKGVINGGNLDIVGSVGIKSGEIKISVNNVALPSSVDIRADYYVSSFDISSFSGKIDYNMDSFNIAPISLSGLPDFLDSPETNIVIANPQIIVSINNPVAQYGLKGTGKIQLTSSFNNGESIERESSEFILEGTHSDLAFCTPKEGFTYISFDGLRNVLSSSSTNPDGLPSSIKVNIRDLKFAGTVSDFPLGYVGSADGIYGFEAPLGFGIGSKVIYETTEGDWGSEDLDKVNINKIHLNANCTTNLPVGVQLRLYPVDKQGNVIAVKEESALFSVEAKCTNSPVELTIEGLNGPIHGFDGIKFRAYVSQENENNTEALGPDLFIKLDAIRVTVDGYYETDF